MPNNELEDKNQYSTATTTKKNSFDISDPSIIEKLKIENIGPGFQSSNINNIINILFKNHEVDLVTYFRRINNNRR